MYTTPKMALAEHDDDPSLYVTVYFEETSEGQACCHRNAKMHSNGKFGIFRFDIETREGLAACKRTHLLKLKCDECGATDAEE